MAEEDNFVGLSQFDRERSPDGGGENISGVKYGCIVGFTYQPFNGGHHGGKFMEVY